MAVNIIIGGDLCPINRSEELLIQGQVGSLFNDLFPELEAADLFIANLECPLIEHPTPILKNGPVLSARSACAQGLGRIPRLALGISNNHILDHGRQGVADTLHHCRHAGIATFGAGLDLAEARKVHIRSVKGVRIGLLAMAENERCLASDNRAGANPLEFLNAHRQISNARSTCDFLIVLAHGGVEHYPFPTPKLQELCRFMVEQGANAVICQHSHCAGCHERYQGATIVYGQGNLLFDLPNRGPEWHRGFLVKLKIGDDFSSEMQMIPYTQFLDQVGTRKMPQEMAQSFCSGIEQRSLLIEDEKSVRDAWHSYCAEKAVEYIGTVLGHGRILRRLNRDGMLLGTLYSEEELFKLNNIVQCEAHREILLTALDQLLQKLERKRASMAI